MLFVLYASVALIDLYNSEDLLMPIDLVVVGLFLLICLSLLVSCGFGLCLFGCSFDLFGFGYLGL